eukprot:gene17010-18723_t
MPIFVEDTDRLRKKLEQSNAKHQQQCFNKVHHRPLNTSRPIFQCPNCKDVFYFGENSRRQPWTSHYVNCTKTNVTAESPVITMRGSKAGRARTVSDSTRRHQVVVHGGNHNVFAYSQVKLSLEIASKLRSDGVCVVHNLVQPDKADAVHRELQSMYNVTGNFTPGKLCQNTISASTIRGDEVKWLDGSPEQTPCLWMVKKKLNRLAASLYSLHSVPIHKVSHSKVMASCYNGCGTAYKRHIDSPCEGTYKLTFVIYLNKDVKSEQGGCLRIHKLNGQSMDIKPELGTLVIFRSDKIIHEVTPCYFQRFALTIWYKEVPNKHTVSDASLEDIHGNDVDDDKHVAESSAMPRSARMFMNGKKIKLEPKD